MSDLSFPKWGASIKVIMLLINTQRCPDNGCCMFLQLCTPCGTPRRATGLEQQQQPTANNAQPTTDNTSPRPDYDLSVAIVAQARQLVAVCVCVWVGGGAQPWALRKCFCRGEVKARRGGARRARRGGVRGGEARWGGARARGAQHTHRGGGGRRRGRIGVATRPGGAAAGVVGPARSPSNSARNSSHTRRRLMSPSPLQSTGAALLLQWQ